MDDSQSCPNRECPIDVDLLGGIRDMAAFRRVGTILSGILTAAMIGVTGWVVGLQSAINTLENVDSDRGARLAIVEATQRMVVTEVTAQGRQDATQSEAISHVMSRLTSMETKLDQIYSRLLERNNGGGK